MNLYLTTTGLAAAGGVVAGWTLIDTMNPAKDVLALASTEVDLSTVEVGQSLTVMWRGKPVFIRHRTIDEINEARNVQIDDLKQQGTLQIFFPTFHRRMLICSVFSECLLRCGIFMTSI